MPNACKKSPEHTQDDTVAYSVNPDIFVKGKTSISKEAAIEYIHKLAAQMPEDPS